MDKDGKLLKEMGKRIYEARTHMGYTQEALANKLSLSYRTISAAENGHKALRPENLIKLCEALQVSADYILTGKESPKDYDLVNHKFPNLDKKQYEALKNIMTIIGDDKN